MLVLAQTSVGVHGLTGGVEERSSPLLLSNHVEVLVLLLKRCWRQKQAPCRWEQQ